MYLQFHDTTTKASRAELVNEFDELRHVLERQFAVLLALCTQLVDLPRGQRFEVHADFLSNPRAAFFSTGRSSVGRNRMRSMSA
jgi:hypothetical protein